MLLELRVRNLGIIDELNWRLEPGLNVITGETGAGKSLVIDAVETLLGGKADDESIRHGASEAVIEGVFALGKGGSFARMREFLAEKGLAADEETLVIKCEFRRQGRSTIRMNGQAVPRSLLGQMEHFLIDIHGQSEHLSLLDRKFHLDFMDAYAHNMEPRSDFAARAAELRNMEQELRALSEEERDRARREEYLRFQIDEISRARLREGEEEELLTERNVLSSCEKLKTYSYEAYQSLQGDNDALSPSSAVDRLSQAMQSLKKIVELDPTLKKQLDFLEEALYGLEEAGRDIRSYGDRLEYDPARLEEVELRLELIRNLKRKYGQTIAEILGHLGKAEGELEGLSHSSQRRAELEEQRRHLKEEMGKTAFALSKARSQVAGKLVSEVKKELSELNMPQVDFEVAITQLQSEDGIPLPDGKTYAFTNEGVDSVEFIASTNPGEPLKPLARIASTGEMSRFMLALKSALSAADSTPVLVFDEIDIGIGGRSGEIIGKKLWALARSHQVICVTHLPQIAAFADAHYRVNKEASGERTVTRLESLRDDSHLREIAAMLGGAQYSETSLENTRELIAKAESWKGNLR